MQAERQAGRDLSRRAETVKDLLDDWLETVTPHIRASTKSYYRVGCQHIITRIGKLKAQDVTVEIIQRMINDMTKDDIKPATLRAALTRLHSAYDQHIPERFNYNPVAWKRLRIRITQQRAQRSEKLFSPPKTDESARTLPLGPQLAKRLQQHLESQQAERKFRGNAWMASLLHSYYGCWSTCSGHLGRPWRNTAHSPNTAAASEPAVKKPPDR